MNRSIDHHPQRNKYCGASAQVIVAINIGQHWCLGIRQPRRSEIDFGTRPIYQCVLEIALNTIAISRQSRQHLWLINAVGIPYIMKDNINIDSEKDFIYLDIMRKLNKVKIWGVDK